jgi:uncharacterized protein (TIGR03437 family)
VQDDCGAPLTSGSVTAEFSNGDPVVTLAPLANGRWDGTWQPGGNSTGATVTVRAISAGKQLTGSGHVTVAGELTPSLQPPVIPIDGVTNAAANLPFQPLAPGGLITISGSLLSDQTASAATVPLPLSLGDTSVLIDFQPMSIATTDPGKVSAIIPYGLAVNTQHQVLLGRGLTLSLPDPINLAPANPAVFTTDGSQGMIADSNGNPITPGNPAKAALYCTGLGELNPALEAGGYGPASSGTNIPVTVTIGGQTATVSHSGLAPQLVGIYFVTATVPAGVPTENQVPVTVTSLSTPPATSPAVNIAIGN